MKPPDRVNNGNFRRRPAGPSAAAPEPLAPGLAARIAAAQILADTLTMGRPLDERFSGDSAHARLNGLDARDRALARSIVTVSLRRLGTIRKALGAFLDKGLPKKSGSLEWTLIVAAAQMLFLDTPDHAAVDLAVRAARVEPAAAPFAALVNGVLRNVARVRQDILDGSDALDDDTPAWLAARWRANYGAPTRATRSPWLIATSRRSISASRATPKAGRGVSAGSSCRPARCGSNPTLRSTNSKATRKANGGCRTPARRCRRGC